MKSLSEKVQAMLETIAERSLNGEIEWRVNSPSMFSWRKDPNVVTLQRALKPRGLTVSLSALQAATHEANYLFNMQNLPMNETVASFSSQDFPDIADTLERMWNGANRYQEIQVERALQSLLD